MEISGFEFVELNGGTYLRDPESGALIPAISGGDEMGWDDSGTSDYGSFDSNDYAGFEWASPIDVPAPYTGPLSSPYYSGGSDVLGSQGAYPSSADAATGQMWNPAAPYDPSLTGGLNTPDFVLNRQGLPVGIDPATGQVTGALPGVNYGGGGAGGGGGMGGGSANPWLAGGLGAVGGLAGLLGSLVSGGVTSQSQPNLSTAQKALSQYGVQSLQGLNPFIQGTSPLQQQQGSLLQAIANGQIPPAITKLVQSAYDPVMQNLWTQAESAGRNAGFFDQGALSPPGGAFLGPALAQAQGQMSGDILSLMQSLPGVYQNPINAQIGAAQNQASGYNTAFGNYPTGQTNRQPIGAAVGQGLANVASGAAQGYAGQQAQQQQQNTNNMLMAMAMGGGRGGTTSLSGY